MSVLLPADEAVALLRRGGVIAYPTEAVWGLGCDPANGDAVMRLLALKARPTTKGLILVAATIGQLDDVADWGALPDERRAIVLDSWPGPHTWVVPALPGVPAWITGGRPDVAVRVSAHRQVAQLCRGFGGPIVSTSANRAGLAPPRTRWELDPVLLADLDGVVAGETGGLSRPTDIRDARSGSELRS